jgi:hypothetical protein
MNPQLLNNFRVSKKDFTRVRKQTFTTTLLFMMNFLCKSLSLEIENFISHIRSFPGYTSFSWFSKSAFVQCRKKINPEVFKYLSNRLTEEFYTDNDDSIKLWNGFRLLAIDGSVLTLPDTKELENIYGRTKNQSETGVIQARVSVLYDVINNFVLDGSLSTVSTGENAMALKHLDYSTNGDLIIYDRGYPSFNLINEHYDRGIEFLIRTKISFNNATREFYESGLSSDIVRIYPGKNIKLSDKPYTKDSYRVVRLVRVQLKSGETEILITSLMDPEKFPNQLFKKLYYMRWGVETFYDELKNKIKAEHFSGYSQHSIMQDFYAALFVSNVQSLIVRDINEELAKESEGNKYQYKVNTNISYGFLKDRVITLFFSNKDMATITVELKELFKKHTIPIRPNRKFERDVDKYRKKTKPKVLKTRRDAL